LTLDIWLTDDWSTSALAFKPPSSKSSFTASNSPLAHCLLDQGQFCGHSDRRECFLKSYAIEWNYLYNLGFKRFYGNNPDAYGIGLRLLHTLGGEGRLILVTVPAITWALEAGILGASYSTTPCLTGSITACGARPSVHQGVLLKGNYYVGDFCCSSNSLPQMLVYLG